MSYRGGPNGLMVFLKTAKRKINSLECIAHVAPYGLSLYEGFISVFYDKDFIFEMEGVNNDQDHFRKPISRKYNN